MPKKVNIGDSTHIKVLRAGVVVGFVGGTLAAPWVPGILKLSRRLPFTVGWRCVLGGLRGAWAAPSRGFWGARTGLGQRPILHRKTKLIMRIFQNINLNCRDPFHIYISMTFCRLKLLLINQKASRHSTHPQQTANIP